MKAAILSFWISLDADWGQAFSGLVSGRISREVLNEYVCTSLSLDYTVSMLLALIWDGPILLDISEQWTIIHSIIFFKLIARQCERSLLHFQILQLTSRGHVVLCTLPTSSAVTAVGSRVQPCWMASSPSNHVLNSTRLPNQPTTGQVLKNQRRMTAPAGSQSLGLVRKIFYLFFWYLRTIIRDITGRYHLI